jgi:2,5-diketo-D-gluconate reductase B
MDIETLTVQGVEVPRLGYGTWMVTGNDATEGVEDALDLGYRHIDTARAYENEAEVGKGLAASPVDRGDIWLTTKLWQQGLTPEKVREDAEDSLRKLGTDYVDLLLLHWPDPDIDLPAVLEAMAGLKEDGKARTIGVSNFPSAQLRDALSHQTLLTDQVEYHAMLGQRDILDVCEEHDLMLTAYSPFSRGKLLDEPTLTEIGEAHGKTAGQVALRWLLDQPRVVVIPKASSRERREANLQVFDFHLGDDERARIDALPKDRRELSPSFAPDWDPPRH